MDFSARSLPTLLAVVALAGFLVLFFAAASRHSLSPDEGYYGRGAQFFADGDVLLRTVDTDKPPLAFQVFGVSLRLFGRTEFALKLPNALALGFLLAITFWLGRRLFGAAVGALAACLLATSPHFARVGIGAMTDPLASVFLLGAVLLAVRGRFLGSGLCVGLALCTRQMALLFAPIPLLAGWLLYQPRARLWSVVKRFAWGLTGPVAYLVLWSAFFEKQPFRWLWHEFTTGKVVLGAAKTGPAGRLLHWLRLIAGDFFLSPYFWLVVAVVAMWLLVRSGWKGRSVDSRIRGNDNLKPQASSLKPIYGLLGGAVVYHVLIHVVIGIPLYDRMMMPILPLVCLLAASVIVSGFTAVGWTSRRWRWIGAAALAVMVIVGVHRNWQMFQPVDDRDDVPEIARVIRNLPPGKKVLVSDEMSRMFFFPLHRSGIPLEQHKGEAEKFDGLLRKYADRQTLLVVGSPEVETIATWQHERAATQRFELLAESSHRRLRLYEVEPAAKVVRDSTGVFIEGTDSAAPIPVTAVTIADRVRGFVENALRSTAPSVEFEPDPTRPLEGGHFARLELRAANALVQQVRAQSVAIRYRDGRIDLPRLFANGQLVLRDLAEVSGTVEVAGEELAEFIRAKNPMLADASLRISPAGLRLTGCVTILGRPREFRMAGMLAVNRRGEVLFQTREAELAGVNLPAALLGYLGDAMNPAFKTRIDSLGLQGVALRLGDGRIAFDLARAEE